MNPSAIITGDNHYTESRPKCRTDDWMDTLEQKTAFIQLLQTKFGGRKIPILDAGDLVNGWRCSPFLLAWIIKHMTKDKSRITVPGNHDLPSHNLGLIEKSGLHVLEAAGVVTVLRYGESYPVVDPRRGESGMNGEYWETDGADFLIDGIPWGLSHRVVTDEWTQSFSRRVLLFHVMTYMGKKPWPGLEAPTAEQILEMYPEYDLIITGHNHKPFTCGVDGRLLVNPGSIFRMSADQIRHEPRVYLWYAETNHIEEVKIPIERDVITRDHIVTVEEREERMEAFVSSIQEWDVGLSFQRNLEGYFSKNETREPVKREVMAAVGGDGGR